MEVNETEGQNRRNFPSHWHEVRLLMLLQLSKVGSPGATDNLATEDGTIALIHSGDLNNTKEVRINKKVREEVAKAKRLESIERGTGTILMAIARDKIGKVGMLNVERAIIHNAVWAITPDTDKVLPDFLFYFLKSRSSQIKASFGTGTYSSKKIIEQTPVPISPDQTEQRQIITRIEARLADVQQGNELVEKTQQNIDRALYLALGEVFASDRRTAWGRPVPLRTLVTIRHKPQRIAQNTFGAYTYISEKEIEPGTGLLRNPGTLGGRDKRDDRAKYLLENAQNVVLYVQSSADKRRVAALTHDRVVCSANIFPLSIIDPERLSPDFLKWALLTPFFTQFALGGSSISRDRLLDYSFSLPEPDEQKHIVRYLQNIQQTLTQMREAVNNNRQYLEQLEQEILRKAFRGEL